jgi:hypothetical protein
MREEARENITCRDQCWNKETPQGRVNGTQRCHIMEFRHNFFKEHKSKWKRNNQYIIGAMFDWLL